MAGVVPRAFVVSAAVAAALAVTGCSREKRDEPRPSASALAASAARAPSPKETRAADLPRSAAVVDFLAGSDCTFGHRGVLVDLGDPTTRARMSGGRLASANAEVREHEGASWVSVRSRTFELSFVSASELKSDAGIVIEARARGGAAKSATAYLNGKPIGTLALTKGETRITSTRAQGFVARGANELVLRFNGGARAQQEQLAEIDWVRVGPNDGDAPYSAPTRPDVLSTVRIGGTPRRSVTLRAPGFARCSAFIPSGSMLEGFIGVTGGEAEAEVRVLVDRAEPRVVGRFQLGKPGDPPWRPVSLPLGELDTIAGVELVTESSTKGARVAFAEPRITAPGAADRKAAPALTPARGVVLVVLGTTSRRIALYGGPTAVPELSTLADGGVIFDAHRATSSFANGSLGSMLTGLLPREHGASDPDGALSPRVATVAEALRQAGVVTAMFTANPTTSEAFGFGRGWETFVAHAPSGEKPATTIFEEASDWLEAHKSERFFLVVHARGGHPPWDVTSEVLQELPPQGYQGGLEPKSAAEALAKARKAGGRSFADADRERAFALHARAVAAHDAALGALLGRVRTIGREGDTAWIVTGDVGVDAAARVPFLEDDSLEEGGLAVPLVVRGLGDGPRGHVSTATSSVDVARTILDALGLPPPAQLRGESLWALAGQTAPRPERPLVSNTTTRFSIRWGAFALVGAREREQKLCNLSLDPDCVSDVRASHPLAAEVLHSLAWRELVEQRGARLKSGSPVIAPRAAVDDAAAAALRAWGR